MLPQRNPLLTLLFALVALGTFGGFWFGDFWASSFANTQKGLSHTAQAAATVEPDHKISYRIQVRDDEQQPVERAFVSLRHYPEYQWFTNQDGEVTLRVEAQARDVTIVANGFITQTFQLPLVQGLDKVEVSYQLKPNPMLLGE